MVARRTCAVSRSRRREWGRRIGSYRCKTALSAPFPLRVRRDASHDRKRGRLIRQVRRLNVSRRRKRIRRRRPVGEDPSEPNKSMYLHPIRRSDPHPPVRETAEVCRATVRPPDRKRRRLRVASGDLCRRQKQRPRRQPRPPCYRALCTPAGST